VEALKTQKQLQDQIENRTKQMISDFEEAYQAINQLLLRLQQGETN
jgi:hypothetical protein